MTPLPSFPFAGLPVVSALGTTVAGETDTLDNLPLAEGETPAVFACMLELCAEPARVVPPAPLETRVIPPAPEACVMAELPALVLETTARSLDLELPEVPDKPVEREDEPLEVPVEILSLGVLPPITTPLPQSTVVPEPARSAKIGVEQEITVVDKKLRSQEEPAAVSPPVSISTRETPSSEIPDLVKTQPVTPDRILPAVARKHVETALPTTTEKIAVPVQTLNDRPSISVSRSPEYKFLIADKQEEAANLERRGTVNANPPVDMQSPAEPTPFQPAPVQSRTDVQTPGTIVVNMAAPVVASATLSAPATPEATLSREISLPAADAAAVVREVAELTHDFRFHERSSVEVKFNFKDDTELFVRLAYRDGDVHATFRTDSTVLRDTLGREWEGYVAQVAQDPRAYRMAEPVFTSSGDFSSAPQGRDSGSATGGDARNQQPFSNPDRSGSPHAAARTLESRSHTVVPAPRVSSDRLLHAFA